MSSKIHGKQIKDASIKLVKIDPSTGQTLTLTGNSKIQQAQAPTTDQDLTNKYYVDSVAAGFDPKESSRVATLVDLISIGATYSPTGGTSGTGAMLLAPITLDGVGLTAGDRILVKDQIDARENGIYVVISATATSTWYRSSDMDGNPTAEISVGNFSFVTEGTTYGGNGFVVVASGTWSGVLPVNTAPIVWTQFSGGGSFIWGDGLSNLGNVIGVDLAPSSGLTFSSTKLTIDSNIAGSGLAWASGVINIGQGNGITVNSNDIQVNYTEVSNALVSGGTSSSLTASAGYLSVMIDNATITRNNSGQLVANITSAEGLAGAGLTAVGSTLSVGAGAGITVSSDAVAVDYVAVAIALEGSGLTASAGKLNINTSNGITIINDSVQLDQVVAGNGLTYSAGVIDINTSNGVTIINDSVQINSSAAGTGLTFNAGIFDINTSNGITIINDSVQLDQAVAGDGLTYSAGVININVAKGVTFSGDYLFSDASTILTTAFLPSSNVATNSTIQSALAAIDSYINGLQAATIISTYNNPTGTFLSSISTPVIVNNGVTYSRQSDGEAFVFVNGVNYPVGSATSSDFFFSGATAYSGSVTGSNAIYIGQYLWSNVSTLGFDIDTTDEIIVKYNAI